MAHKRMITGALAAGGALTLAFAAPAFADGYSVKDEAPAESGRQFTWSVTVGGYSDYVFRGISQTDEDPALQASFDVGYGIFYAGVWGSNIDFENCCNEDIEIDFYAGLKPVWGPVTFDLGVLYYWYPDTPDSANLDYVEYKIGYSLASPWIKGLTSGTALYYTPDQSGGLDEVLTVESTASYALPQMGVFAPSISGAYGTAYAEDNIFDGGDDYSYWNVGVSVGVEKFTMDFRYWDTDMSDATCKGTVFQCDERFVFSAKVTLP